MSPNAAQTDWQVKEAIRSAGLDPERVDSRIASAVREAYIRGTGDGFEVGLKATSPTFVPK